MNDPNILTLEEPEVQDGVIAREKELEPETVEEAAEAIHMPAPSFWPIVLAAGLTLLVAGLVSHLIVSAVGLAVMLLALAGWIRQA